MEGRTLELQQAVAPYRQLSTLFRRRIESGSWRVGGQIPTLEDLTQEFRVAPGTVRRALSSLIDEGLLVTVRSKGTFVLKQPSGPKVHDIEMDAIGVLRHRGGAKIKLLASRYVSPLAFRPHEGTAADSYLFFRRLYLQSEQAFAIGDIYVDTALLTALTEKERTAGNGVKVFQRLEALPVCGRRTTLAVSTADLDMANRFDVPLNAPITQVDRTRYDAAGRMIMISRIAYRGDAVRLHMASGEVPSP